MYGAVRNTSLAKRAAVQRRAPSGRYSISAKFANVRTRYRDGACNLDDEISSIGFIGLTHGGTAIGVGPDL